MMLKRGDGFMDVIFGVCLSICFVIIFAVYIRKIVKDSENKDKDKKIKVLTSREMMGEIITEFPTVKFNAEVIDLISQVEMIGIKQPKSVNIYKVTFETDKKEVIKFNVPQEMYDGFEIGQKGELTIVNGELYSFEI